MSFSSWLFGEKASIKKEIIKDPLKEGVASPLSSYLSSQVGQGVPRYGKQILTDLPEGGGASISSFLKLNPETFFNERIKGPALQTFKEDILPIVREDFAGSLSGSGRFRTEEEAGSRFVRGLAETRANLELQLPQAQYTLAAGLKEQADKEAQAQYTDWFKSLPQYNPVLGQAISFLSDSTNTGSTILSFLDPGTEGAFKAILGILASAVGASTGGGGGATRGTTGGANVTSTGVRVPSTYTPAK